MTTPDPREGSLTRLMRMLGDKRPLPSIPTVEPITVRPAEVMFSDKPNAVERIIDLRSRYDIALTQPIPGHWEAIDRVTFDHDPEATLHIRGTGRSSQEAVCDLLEQLAALIATCVCDRESWCENRVRPICKRHRGPAGEPCERCEHDARCHRDESEADEHE